MQKRYRITYINTNTQEEGSEIRSLNQEPKVGDSMGPIQFTNVELL